VHSQFQTEFKYSAGTFVIHLKRVKVDTTPYYSKLQSLLKAAGLQKPVQIRRGVLIFHMEKNMSTANAVRG
jgi:hypothetical protein